MTIRLRVYVPRDYLEYGVIRGNGIGLQMQHQLMFSAS